MGRVCLRQSKMHAAPGQPLDVGHGALGGDGFHRKALPTAPGVDNLADGLAHRVIDALHTASADYKFAAQGEARQHHGYK